MRGGLQAVRGGGGAGGQGHGGHAGAVGDRCGGAGEGVGAWGWLAVGKAGCGWHTGVQKQKLAKGSVKMRSEEAGRKLVVAKRLVGTAKLSRMPGLPPDAGPPVSFCDERSCTLP